MKIAYIITNETWRHRFLAFAAGDILATIPPVEAVTAAGDGATAAINAQKYLI